MARQMKDSGIEWIGEIPEDWEYTKLKYHYDFEKGKNAAIYTQDYIGQHKGDFPVYSGQTENEGVMGRIDSYDYDLIECLFTTTVGAKVMTPRVLKGKFSLSQNCLIMKSKKREVNRYYYYLLQALFDYEKSLIPNYMQPSLRMDDLNTYSFYIPKDIVQERIADYLDQQCAHIDAVIEKTKASIEEYKKLKQAVITEAVTKGVRGERPMKDSGIEWIGETPYEWDLIPFRRVLKERNEKNSPVKSTERLSLSIELGVTLYSEKTTNLDRFKEDFEQYKLAYEGDLVMNSMNMIVGASGVSAYYGCVSPVYYTYYDEEEDHVTAKFCEYIFRSKTMLRVLFSLGKGIYAIVRGDDRVNTCRLKVAKEDLKSLVIPVPSVEEQREIVKYLNSKCLEIEEVIKKKEGFLAELESYKKSLIYEYVTGKKEVPQS